MGGIRAMPVLACAEPQAVAEFLTAGLGFTLAGWWRDADGAPTFGVARLGDATLALRRGEAPSGEPAEGPAAWSACIYVEDARDFATLAAAIGWGTNHLAVRMLFHPREERRILGLRVQGVFPKRQQALAEKLGQLVARELFSMEDVRQHLKGDEFVAHVTATIEGKVDEFLQNNLLQMIPMASMFLGSDMVDKIKHSLVESLAKAVPELGDLFVSHLEKNMDVEAVVRDKVAAFSSDKLEEMLLGIMKREFRFIEGVGAVLGFVIGLAQLGILWLM